jgi:hypothetical protein
MNESLIDDEKISEFADFLIATCTVYIIHRMLDLEDKKIEKISINDCNSNRFLFFDNSLYTFQSSIKPDVLRLNENSKKVIIRNFISNLNNGIREKLNSLSPNILNVLKSNFEKNENKDIAFELLVKIFKNCKIRSNPNSLEVFCYVRNQIKENIRNFLKSKIQETQDLASQNLSVEEELEFITEKTIEKIFTEIKTIQ